MIGEQQAARLSRIALGHVRREFPHILSHVFTGPEDAQMPRALHPIFYGSFDWHSCVHGYWLLAAMRHRYPAMECLGEIEALFDAQITPATVAGECAYFARPTARGYERPYGWAWLLALRQALQGTRWAGTLTPLSDVIAQRFHDYLPKAQYPVRVGTHFNTAFALVVASRYAAAQDPALLALLQAKVAGWYARDAGCQAWEPSQDDFLSSALMEAVCMLRLSPEGAFEAWFARFLPELERRRPAALFEPAAVSDRSDGKIAHLDGLNLSRAWCWREIGDALPAGDARALVAQAAAAEHLASALPHVAGDFMGEHWLASFAALALERELV